MTLDDRIKQDLDDLYNNGIINAAQRLSMGMFGVKNKFSAYGLPGHYTGDRNAKTVMVMLNPGNDVGKANNPINIHNSLLKLGINTASLHDFIDTYKIGCNNFGEIDRNRLDNFDIKQAVFLKSWSGCGVNNLNPFPTKKDKVALRYVKENVLMQKLQLELIPYASSSFIIPSGKNSLLFPFLETLFDEIFNKKVERKYVIFCSDYFQKLFTEYDANNPGSVNFDVKKGKILFKNGNHAYCTPIRIHYNSNSIKAVIAHTFPNKSLPNAYNLMEQYGAFCYDVFTKSTI